MFCVDTGDRGFPGPPGQKGDRGQSLSVPYQRLSYVEPRIYRSFVNAAFFSFFSSGDYRYARRKRETGL